MCSKTKTCKFRLTLELDWQGQMDQEYKEDKDQRERSELEEQEDFPIRHKS